MESVGKFEFSRKHLIGHGAFAVVFKGRHKEKREWEVAVKCISKKNLAKSQSLLGKEIKILKELKHENIVRLLDYQEIGGYVYLVMEYCNGGDLAEYLHCKGTLSEDTIRIFLQQIAQAMKVLQNKDIIHRDLKPQNILLCRPERRKCSPANICIKLADFGFARHLQTNTMAATLCGSPMYMAPEVIMSQHYDAKADLWSIGTIVYQCLTGKAPFHARTPQELRMFYESNATLLPSIPKETSRNLRHLLVGMLQRNHKQRISFDEFFHHPFLDTNSSTKKSSPAQLMSYPSSGSGSSSSGSSTSHPASPQFSKGEVRRPQPKEPASPKEESPVLTPKEIAKEDKGSTSYSEDYVVVPCQYTCVGEMVSLIDSCLIYSGEFLPDERGSSATGKTPPPSPKIPSPTKSVSKPVVCGQSNYSQAVPIPVPTQIQNYQLMEQKLQPVRKHTSKRATRCRADGKCTPQCRSCGRPGFLNTPELATGGALPQQSSPPVGTTPKTTEQTLPPSSKTGLITVSPDMHTSSPKHVHSRMPNRTRNVKDLQSLLTSPATQTSLSRKPHTKKGSFRRSLSTGMLSEMLLKAVFGAHLFQEGTDEMPNFEKSMDITAPPTGFHSGLQCSPPAAVFTIDFPSKSDSPQMNSVSPSYINSPWLPNNLLQLGGSRRNSQSEAMDASPPSCVVFHPPELPADTLMEQPHIDALSNLRFTLAFVHCIMEFASSKGPGPGSLGSPDVSFLEQSLVTDQISLLSKEWSYSEQLVLYMKAEEFLSSALHTAKKDIIQGQLHPYASVKQVIRKLNELYKNCVTSCRALNRQLETFLLDKQKLMEHFNGLSVEKLLYSHTVHMVQSAALDEMFHYGTTSVPRYHKALLLMEGLSRIMIEPKDVESIDKCKECIERRLSALQA